MDLELIKKYYNIDKYSKEINQMRIYELNGHLNQQYYPQDQENIIIAPNLQAQLNFNNKELLNSENNKLGSNDKKNFKLSLSNFKLKSSRNFFLISSIFDRV